jgi:hypothetical protein
MEDSSGAQMMLELFDTNTKLHDAQVIYIVFIGTIGRQQSMEAGLERGKTHDAIQY